MPPNPAKRVLKDNSKNAFRFGSKVLPNGTILVDNVKISKTKNIKNRMLQIPKDKYEIQV